MRGLRFFVSHNNENLEMEIELSTHRPNLRDLYVVVT